jgi:uncharacterized damage-inducible protein DinB
MGKFLSAILNNPFYIRKEDKIKLKKMKDTLQQFASYNHWANQAITDTILMMDEHLHQQHIPSSFPNLYATVLHMWDAESIWWQRMHKHEKLLVPSQNFNPNMKEAINGLLSQSDLWAQYVTQASDHDLRQQLEYRNMKKELFTQPLDQVLLHVFNHGTYHRGQLVTMMRALGQESIPQTDFIVWSRKVRV